MSRKKSKEQGKRGRSRLRRRWPAVAVMLLLMLMSVQTVGSLGNRTLTSDEQGYLDAGRKLAHGEPTDSRYPLSFLWHGLARRVTETEDSPREAYVARVSMVVFLWVLGIYLYRWSSELFGRPAGVTAVGLLAFCPNFLGHGALVAPDVSLAAMVLPAAYYLWQSFTRPSGRSWLLCGLFTGLAISAKFNGVLLGPAAVVVGLAAWLGRREWTFGGPWVLHRRPGRTWGLLGLAGFWAGIAAVALLVLGVFFGYSGWGRPLRSFELTSRTLARLCQTPLGRVPVPMPAAVVTGLDYQQRRNELGHPAFLMGRRRLSGWWYYFPIAFLVKTPIPMLVLLMGGLVAARWSFRQHPLALVCVIAVPALMAAHLIFFNSNMGGLRYLLPGYPFVFLIASGVIALVLSRRFRWGLLPAYGALAALGVWYVAGSVMIRPSYLAYFNEAAGGPRQGYRWLGDSNLNWGSVDLTVLSSQAGSSRKPLRWELGPRPVTGRIPVVADELQGTFQGRPELDWLWGFEPADEIEYGTLIYEVHLTDYEARVAHSPRDASVHWALASALLDRGDLNLALAEAQRAASLDPSSAPARLLTGMVLLRLGRVPEAAADFERAASLDPTDPEPPRRLAFIDETEGRTSQAETRRRLAVFLEMRARYREHPPESDPGLIESELVSAPAGDGRAALLNNLGVLFWRDGEDVEAVQLLQQSLAEWPGSVDTRSNLAFVQLWAGNMREAVAQTGQARELEKEGRRRAAVLTVWRENEILAGERWALPPVPVKKLAAELARSNNALRQDGYVWLMVEHNRSGDGVGARRVAELAEKAGQGGVPVYLGLGEVYLTEGFLDRAMEACRRAESSGADRADLLSLTGRIHLARGERDQAKTALTEALTLRPDSRQIRHYLGLVEFFQTDAPTAPPAAPSPSR